MEKEPHGALPKLQPPRHHLRFSAEQQHPPKGPSRPLQGPSLDQTASHLHMPPSHRQVGARQPPGPSSAGYHSAATWNAPSPSARWARRRLVPADANGGTSRRIEEDGDDELGVCSGGLEGTLTLGVWSRQVSEHVCSGFWRGDAGWIQQRRPDGMDEDARAVCDSWGDGLGLGLRILALRIGGGGEGSEHLSG